MGRVVGASGRGENMIIKDITITYDKNNTKQVFINAKTDKGFYFVEESEVDENILVTMTRKDISKWCIYNTKLDYFYGKGITREEFKEVNDAIYKSHLKNSEGLLRKEVYHGL